MSGQTRGVRAAKGVLFILSRVAIVLIVLALVVLAYYTAMNTMTVDMITKDAFARRAQAVLTPASDDTVALDKLFTQQALMSDNVLNSGMYEGYNVISYYERADIDNHIVWAWSGETIIKVTDVVRDITVEQPDPDENGTVSKVTALEWPTGVYEVKLVKDKTTDAWKVDGAELVELIHFEKEPEATVSPLPEETPPEAQATEITGEITSE